MLQLEIKMKKIWFVLAIICIIGLVGAITEIFTEPWNSNQRGGGHNLTDMGTISANIFEGTSIFVSNIFGSNSWCYQEYSNTSTACGGLSTGLYASSNNFSNNGSAFDGNFSTYTELNGTNGTIGYLYINYTKPSTATHASLWTIKRAVAINNYSIDSLCWSQSNTLIFRGVVKNLSVLGNVSVTENFWQCFNGSNYLNVTAAQSGAKMYEEAMTWRFSSEASLNATLDWDKLQNYPSACPGSSAVTQLNDSVVCSDLWVDSAGGDTITGNLTMTGNLSIDGAINLNISHYLRFNGSCIVAIGIDQTGACL